MSGCRDLIVFLLVYPESDVEVKGESER